MCLPRFINLFDKYDVKKKLKIKLKTPSELQVQGVYKVLLCHQFVTWVLLLQDVLNVTNDILEEIQTKPSLHIGSTEFVKNLKQAQSVLEM